jgi:hypothetical protein
MNDPQTTGAWSEERLWVLRTLDEVKAEQKRLAESAAVDRAALIEKGARDIKAAHDKIRALETTGTTLRLKNWLMTLVLSGIGAVAFEVVKALLHGWKL